MRKSLILIPIILMACSTTPQQKAENAIKEYLKRNLNDPSSYEKVETKMDSFYANYHNTKSFKQLKDSFAIIDKKYDISSSNAINELNEFTNMVNALADTIEVRKQRFKPVFYGWQVEHKYRAKNAFGALILTTDTFYLNQDFQIMKRDTIQL